MPVTASFSERFEHVVPLSPAEREFLASFEYGRRVKFRSGEELLAEGEPIDCAYLLKSGWAHCHSELADGRRQVFQFLIKHDIIGFIGATLDVSWRRRGKRTEQIRANYGTTALTDVEAIVIGRPAIEQLVDRFPLLCSALCSFLALENFEILAEHIMNTGRRSASERIAHLFLELWRRQRAIGLTSENEFSLPMNQSVLGDALGLSAVHVSRVLGRFTEENVISAIRQAPQRIIVHDIDRLHKIAGIEPNEDLAIEERRDLHLVQCIPGPM